MSANPQLPAKTALNDLLEHFFAFWEPNVAVLSQEKWVNANTVLVSNQELPTSRPDNTIIKKIELV